MWSLLLYLGPDYYFLIHWWELPSIWLVKKPNPPHMLYAVVLVLTEQSKTAQNNTKTSNAPDHHSNVTSNRAKDTKIRTRNGVVEKWKKKKNMRKPKERKVIMRGERERELLLLIRQKRSIRGIRMGKRGSRTTFSWRWCDIPLWKTQSINDKTNWNNKTIL